MLKYKMKVKFFFKRYHKDVTSLVVHASNAGGLGQSLVRKPDPICHN